MTTKRLLERADLGQLEDDSPTPETCRWIHCQETPIEEAWYCKLHDGMIKTKREDDPHWMWARMSREQKRARNEEVASWEAGAIATMRDGLHECHDGDSCHDEINRMLGEWDRPIQDDRTAAPAVKRKRRRHGKS